MTKNNINLEALIKEIEDILRTPVKTIDNKKLLSVYSKATKHLIKNLNNPQYKELIIELMSNTHAFIYKTFCLSKDKSLEKIIEQIRNQMWDEK